MNDLNLLVSHALSAVRDAQQSVQGDAGDDAGNGEDAQPLLAGFADVMQGLIVLAQTAPQTEDAFDYANTAMLQNLLATEDEEDVQVLDLEAADAENDDGAAEVLLDEIEVPQAITQDPLTLAFSPLQETIASMLMAQTPAAGAQAESATTQVAAQAADTPQVAPPTVQHAPLPQAPTVPGPVENAPATAATAQQTALAAQAAEALAEAQSLQPTPAPVSAPQAQAAQAVAPGDASASQAAIRAAGNAARQSDTTQIAAATQAVLAQQAPTSSDATPATAAPTPAIEAAAPMPAESVDAAIAARIEAQAERTADAKPQAMPFDFVKEAARAQDRHASQDETHKVQNTQDKKAAAAQQPARPVSTIAERQAARHVQNYQQMTEQPTLPAPASQSAPTAPMTASFAPAGTVATQPVDAAAPAVNLPAVTLPNLPADLTNALAAGAKRVRIEINPPALGSVEVGVHLRDGAVFVSMQADNANVAQHIERHLQDLRTHLKDAGLSLGGFEMSSRGDASGQHASHSGTSQERLWTDDMLQLAVDPAALPLEDIVAPVVSHHRPGGINVVA